jgi:ligand-binding SRPBCC domain-containing protein
MRVHVLEREQLVPRPLDEVFAFFAQARNLERITPPWLRFQLLTPEPIAMGPGTVIDYRLRLRGLPLRWLSRIDEWEHERAFADHQLRGPYRLWHHRHEFVPCGGATVVRDRVRYALPLGRLGSLAHAAIVRRDLERIFDYRRAAVRRLLDERRAG